MTNWTPGRTAGVDNRRPTRSPLLLQRNTPIMPQNDPDRYVWPIPPRRGLVTVTKYGSDPLIWPHCSSLIWPHLVVCGAPEFSFDLAPPWRGALAGSEGVV